MILLGASKLLAKKRRKLVRDLQAMRRMPIEELKNEPMMAHLIDHLDSGLGIGHYGRLIFAMVARHFLEPDQLISYLEKDPECNPEQAKSLLAQVQARDY